MTGVLVLIGWWLEIAAFKSMLPGLATMKPNTAVAFVFCGAGLWLKQKISIKSRSHRTIATACASMTFIIAFLTLLEHSTGIDLSIDQLLFSDAANTAIVHPSRMAAATAIGFLLLGTALLLFDIETKWGIYLSQALALLTGLIALTTLIAYAYDLQILYRIEAFSSVALHTALLFFVLSGGILAAHAKQNLAARPPFRFGLAPQVITLVVAAVVLAGGIISAVMLRRSQSTLREQIIANNLAAIDLAAEFARRYIEGTQISIQLFARSPFIEQSVLSNDFSRATPELQEFLQLNQRVNGCSIVDDKGIYRATGTSPATSLGTSASKREWFQSAMTSGEAYLGLPTMTRSTARSVIPYVVPIRNSKGTVKGLLLCGISLAALNDAFTKFQTGPSAQASLTDLRRGGIILAAPDRSRILKPAAGRNKAADHLRGERGTMETRDSAGELNLAVYAPVPGLPWEIMILQPTNAAFAPINTAARENILYIAVLLLFTAVVTGILARRVTQPLARLRAAASQLGVGELTTRLNFTRQDELGELGRTFDQMAATLDERSMQLKAANNELQSQYLQVRDANRLKSEFLANMSHELRTPLNAIIGFAQLLHDGKVGPIGANQKEYLSDILTSADHLLQLINDVLDLSKVESGKLEFQPETVNLAKLITEVRNILQPLAVGKHLTISVEVADALAQVVIDPAKLKQILYNYLSNAIKFTPEDGRITVRAHATENPADFRLEVEDTGIGIMADEVAKLFIAFQQLDSSTAKKHQGTGLGLALTKKIVEAQGGRVGVRSARGQGSVFFAILPIAAKTKSDSGVASKPLAAPGDAPTILIIEDSETDLRWLMQTLTEARYSFDSAKTGAEALAKAQSHAYAAVLLDLILPDTGGWDVLRAIRTGGPNKTTPVIVITVVAEKGVAKGFEVQDYLVKPVRAETLMDSLRSAGILPRTSDKQVLVVDDDAKTLKLSKIGLEAVGYGVVCHTDASNALDDAIHSEFAAVVLDLLMPQMDGFEFLDRFRQIHGCQNTPVIIWTNKDVTNADMQRLKVSAQAIALKGRDGIDTVLQELQRHGVSVSGPDQSAARHAGPIWIDG